MKQSRSIILLALALAAALPAHARNYLTAVRVHSGARIDITIYVLWTPLGAFQVPFPFHWRPLWP